MSNVLDKSFIHRSYPKLAYGSIYEYLASQTTYIIAVLHCAGKVEGSDSTLRLQILGHDEKI